MLLQGMLLESNKQFGAGDQKPEIRKDSGLESRVVVNFRAARHFGCLEKKY